MNTLKNKIAAITISIFFILSMTASIILIPSASAHTPPYTILDYGYITGAPNPVGVGQAISISMWVDYPLPGALLINNIRRANYTLTVTPPPGATNGGGTAVGIVSSPTGTSSSEFWASVADPTGIQSVIYTPNTVGTYNFKFTYPGQIYNWTSSTIGSTSGAPLAAQYTAYDGDFFTACSANINVTVTQTPVPSPIDTLSSAPTAFWTYPIDGQNDYWFSIASNWLGQPFITGSAPGTHDPGMTQPAGSAPTTAHIMWTMPIQYGGVVGGNETAIPGESWYEGSVYNPRFMNPIIIQGTLFFSEPYGNSGSGGPYVAIDLETGQQLWSINTTQNTGPVNNVSLIPSFGYVPDYETPNQYGTLPNGLLIATTTAYPGLGTVWRGYNPSTGLLTSMLVCNVPTGASAPAPTYNTILKYVLTNKGTSTNPNYYLAEWNSSLVFGGGNPNVTTSPLNWYSGEENANVPITPAMPTTTPPSGDAWNWNGAAWVTVPTAQATSTVPSYDWNISVDLQAYGSPTGWAVGTYGGGAGNNYLVDPGNMILMIQGTFGTHVGDVATLTTNGGVNVNTQPANITAISLNPATLGQVLWHQLYPAAPNNLTRTLTAWDPTPTGGYFYFNDKEDFEQWGYSLTTGKEVWESPPVPYSDQVAWDYTQLDNIGYYDGLVIVSGGYSGVAYAYNASTGAQVWTWGNGPVGSTNSTNAGLETAFGVYPEWQCTFADGMIYFSGDVHSPNQPLWKGQQCYCINATTGVVVWSEYDYGQNMYSACMPVAAGYMVAFNCYDSQLYCYSQGPSQTTVNAPNPVTTVGSPIVIRGTVMDISPGAKQTEQAADFPNGVPCVSDASMSAWMEYVYQQAPEPTNVTGVPVTISVLDSNGNHYTIGTATTDASGMFTLTYWPSISGNFTVYATYAGSNAYYGSSAETSFYASPAPPATAAPTATPTSVANLYFVPAIAGLFVLIIVVAIVLALLMLRKRP